MDKINWSVDAFILGAVSGTTSVSIYSVASLFNTLFINYKTYIYSGIILLVIVNLLYLIFKYRKNERQN